MSKKKKRGSKGKADLWSIPKNAADYFDPHYDDDFKREHPILYWLTVLAILVLVMVGPIGYIILCATVAPPMNWFLFAVWVVGFLSSFGLSIGFCNIFLRVHGQYLGHAVTLFSLLIGTVIPGGTLLLFWLL